MKKRILAQILILCTVFSALHMTAWATPDVIPYPYIEDVRDNGEIPADKFLTIIATSNDLNITSIALRAINADSGKEDIPATSGSLQFSRSSNGCYEYKQDFVLSGALKTSGGKWLFEVTSTYEPIRGGSEAKSSIRKLPNDYEKAHWYPYYTIVNGTPETIPPSPPEKPSVSQTEEPSVSQTEEPVLPPEKPSASQTENPSVLPECHTTDSTDVSKSAWYYDAVKFVGENSLMNGIGNNLFAPDANLSRAQLAQILYNKEGPPIVGSISPFTDVDAGAWYSDAVIWATGRNIVGGYGNGLFGPDDNITREQLAVMLWRYAGKPTASTSYLRKL